VARSSVPAGLVHPTHVSGRYSVRMSTRRVNNAAFGGQTGQYAILTAQAQPPTQVYRIIPGRVWWRRVHWPWRQYRAAVATGTPGVVPPQLAHPGAPGVFVTDRASLRGCDSPADFAWRLSLNAQDQQECQIFGCAVIRPDLPHGFVLAPLPPLPGALPGLTGNGAREWLLAGNIDLDDHMQVHFIERMINGSRYFRLPL